METIYFKRYQNKCRICLHSFRKDQLKISITEDIESKFLSISQIELRRSAKYSNKICWICKKELETFADYKNRVSTIQLELYMKYSANEVTAEDSPDFNQLLADMQQVLIKQEIAEKIDKSERTKKKTAIFDDAFSDGSDSFQEPDCGFQSDSDFKEDVKTKNSPPADDWKFKCTVEGCQHLVTRKITLKRHVQEKHSDLAPHELEEFFKKIQKTPNKRPSKKRISFYYCRVCGIRVKNLYKHLRMEHPEAKNVICDLCGFRNFRKQDVRNHIIKTHIKRSAGFPCKLCSKVFPTSGYLSYHTLKEHKNDGTANHYCEICGEGFHNPYRLKDHIKANHTEPTVPCTLEGCEKLFPTLNLMKKHLITHREKNHKCDKCPKAYKKFADLKIHEIRVHSKPTIPCTVERCNKLFGSELLLREHIRGIHMNRNFKCDHCPKDFKTSEDLTKHIARFHQESKFKCPIEDCYVEFARRHRLTHHVVEKHKNLDVFEMEETLAFIKSLTKPK